MIKTAAVIPARYASTRFPGKPLAKIAGKPMIQWTCEKAAASKADIVIVATDDERIKAAVESFGFQAVMTSEDHQSGTDRIAEAIQSIDADLIINLQGDEPILPSSVIDELIDAMLANERWKRTHRLVNSVHHDDIIFFTPSKSCDYFVDLASDNRLQTLCVLLFDFQQILHLSHSKFVPHHLESANIHRGLHIILKKISFQGRHLIRFRDISGERCLWSTHIHWSYKKQEQLR